MRYPRHSSWGRSLALAGLTVLLGVFAARAEEAGLKEYQVKAGYVRYLVLQFVTWPAEAFPEKDSPFVVGIVGKDPFEGVLDALLSGEMMGGRSIVVKHLAAGEELPVCHAVIVGSSAADRLPAILKKLQGRSVLTLGEAKQFLQLGGIIRFTPVGGYLGMEINLDASDQARLKIDSRVLSLDKVRVIRPSTEK